MLLLSRTSRQVGLLATLLTSLSLSNPALSAPEKAWSLEGFDEPESVLAHPSKPLLYVSNMNGNPIALNGKGYISLLSEEGKVIRHSWAVGMDAPKGMAMDEQYLYVADMKRLHIVDLENGEIVRTITEDNSVMLNDITIDDNGVVYISDLLGGSIYRYTDDVLEQWLSGDMLAHPNGLFFDGKQLIVATWGKGLNEDFTTQELGSLLAIDIASKKITPYKNAQQLGNLDGVAKIGDTLWVNDWMNGNVYTYKNNQSEIAFNAGQFAADISSKGNLLFVPMMFSQRVDVFIIEP